MGPAAGADGKPVTAPPDAAAAAAAAAGVSATTEQFNALDKDGSGNLNANEVAAMVSNAGASVTASVQGQAKEIVEKMDKDGDGEISAAEFAAAASEAASAGVAAVVTAVEGSGEKGDQTTQVQFKDGSGNTVAGTVGPDGVVKDANGNTAVGSDGQPVLVASSGHDSAAGKGGANTGSQQSEIVAAEGGTVKLKDASGNIVQGATSADGVVRTEDGQPLISARLDKDGRPTVVDAAGIPVKVRNKAHHLFVKVALVCLVTG